MLKNKKSHYKFPTQKVIIGTSIGLILVLAPFEIDYLVFYAQGQTYMPHEKVVQFCDDLDLETYYFTYADGPFEDTNIRAAFPKNGIKINVYINDLTEKNKQDLQKAVDDLNEVFEVIRPENKFVLDFDPNVFDKVNKYHIDLYEMPESIEALDTCGDWSSNTHWKNKNGWSALNGIIRLKRDKIEYESFMHELFHHLGFGDAYLTPENCDSYNIMMSREMLKPYLHKADVALLAAKYGDYSTPEKKQALVDYINSYESQHDWFKACEKQVNELIDKFVQEKNIDRSQINFDLDDKTFIDTPIAFSQAIQHRKYAFSKQKVTNEKISITMNYSDKIKNDFSDFSSEEIGENINGVTFCQKTSKPCIYCSVNNQLYQISSDYIFTLGQLATQEQVEKFDQLKARWSEADNTALTYELIDQLYPEIDDYIPKTDKKISKGDVINFQFNPLADKITIDTMFTQGDKSYPFEYYKGGIFVPISSTKVVFIFPKDDGSYVYVRAARLFSDAYYYTARLEPEGTDIENEF